MESLLGVSIEANARHAANLYLTNRPGGARFTAVDERLIVTLAGYGRVALEYSRLYRRESDLRLRAEVAEQRLETVIRASSAGVIVVDAETRNVLLATDEAQRILGSELRSGVRRESYETPVRYLRPDGAEFSTDQLPAPVGARHRAALRPDGGGLRQGGRPPHPHSGERGAR